MKKNLMSSRTNLTWLVLLLMVAMNIASCHKNETDPNSDNPGNGGGDNPSVPIVPDDPEGTVTINLNNGADGNWYSIGIGTIHIDNANNFEGMDFVCLGEVEGLGYVTTIPTEGWSNTVAVVPGHGYVAHYHNHYARLYVVEYYISTEGGIMGATVKYQSPFQVPISLETSSLSFDKGEETRSVMLTCPTSVSIEEKPDWCSASVSFNTINVSVAENTSIQRSGEIVLKNDFNTERISIIQQGIAPISLETTSLTFPKEGGSQTIVMENPTIVTVEEKPNWCAISVNVNMINVSVTENPLGLRSGEVILKNDVNSVSISITQQGTTGTTGSGIFEDPYNVVAGINLQNEEPIAWVHGYIVGAVKAGISSVMSDTDINWSEPFDCYTNVVIADDATCREISKCIIVNLPAGKPLRTRVNLVDNPDNLGKHLAVKGKLRRYFGQAGLRDSDGIEDDFVLGE